VAIAVQRVRCSQTEKKHRRFFLLRNTAIQLHAEANVYTTNKSCCETLQTSRTKGYIYVSASCNYILNGFGCVYCKSVSFRC